VRRAEPFLHVEYDFQESWPGLADIFCCPNSFTLAAQRGPSKGSCFWAAWLRLRWRGWPALSIGLVVELKAIALIAGLVTQGTLKAAEYLTRGAERVLPLRAGQGKP